MNLKGNTEGGELHEGSASFCASFAFKFPTLSRDATQTRRRLRLLTIQPARVICCLALVGQDATIIPHPPAQNKPGFWILKG